MFEVKPEGKAKRRNARNKGEQTARDSGKAKQSEEILSKLVRSIRMNDRLNR